MTVLPIIARIEKMLSVNKAWQLDEFTDTVFKRHTSLNLPYVCTDFSVRVSLGAFYEYGEIQYVLAIVYSSNDWRYCRQYEIPYPTYRWLLELLYPWFAGQFSDKGTQKVYCYDWWTGCFQRDYDLGSTLSLPPADWNN